MHLFIYYIDTKRLSKHFSQSKEPSIFTEGINSLNFLPRLIENDPNLRKYSDSIENKIGISKIGDEFIEPYYSLYVGSS